MAEGDHAWYVNGLRAFLAGEIDFDADTIKVAILGTGYTPDYDVHDFWDDVSAQEVSDASYTAGGETLSGKSVTADGTDHEGVATCSNVTYSALDNVTCGYAVVYKDTGTPSTSPLISLIDMASLVANGSDVTLTINAEGLLNLTKV